MTLDEAATSLGLSPSTLRSQILRGSMKGTKAGRDWTVTPREVERYRRESLGRRKPDTAASSTASTPETA